MTLTPVNAPDAPEHGGGYAQTVRLSDFDELVFVSGQIPVGTGGAVPDTFGDQCRLRLAQCRGAAGSGGDGPRGYRQGDDLIADRAHAQENSAIRQEVLAGLTPALTILIAGIHDPAWLLEIEAIAAK